MAASWMVFVDGENFTLEGQKLSKELGHKLPAENRFWREDVYVWLPGYAPPGPELLSGRIARDAVRRSAAH